MAAGGPTVTLIFAGDASQLERTLGTVSTRAGAAVGALAGLGAAGAAASTLVAGAAVAAVGIFGGIGIAAAAQNEQVKKSYAGLAEHVKAETQRMAAPIVPVLTGIADRARATFDAIAPALQTGFAAVAPMIGQLAGGVMSFVELAMPGLLTSLQAAGPIVAVLSEGLGSMGAAVGGFFAAVSTGAPGATLGFQGLFDLINGLLPILGQLVADIANGLGPAFAAMVPYVITAAQWFRDQLAPALMSVGTFIVQNIGWIMQLAGVLLGLVVAVQLVNAGIAIYNGIMTVVRVATTAWAAAQWLVNAAMSANPIGIVIVAIAALVAGIIYAWNTSETFRTVVLAVWAAIQGAVRTAVSTVVGLVTSLINNFNSARARIGAIFSAVGEAITAPFRAAFNGIRSLWNSTVGRIRFTIPSWVPVVGGYSFAMPTFHTGGVVPGAPGQEVMAVLQAGETVLPTQGSRNPGAGGGGSIVRFEGNTSDELATVIMRLIRTGKIQIQAR